jgi:hypothetical protein
LRLSRIEDADNAELVELMAAVLHETGAHNAGRFDAELWAWRYRRLPTGETRVYGLYDEGRLKGYYHAPVYDGWVGERRARIACVQDVAVEGSLRGQGRFRALAEFATADLAGSDIDVIYTFPNERSIHTFLKYNGYHRVRALPTCVLPVRGGGLLPSRLKGPGLVRALDAATDRAMRIFTPRGSAEMKLTVRSAGDAAVAGVFAANEDSPRFRIDRSATYLRWRFEEQPEAKHYVFTADLERADGEAEAGESLAAAIFKVDDIFGSRALMLMDFACRPGGGGALRWLISEAIRAEQEFSGESVDLAFVAAQSAAMASLRRIGFIPVPGVLNPRPLNLLARAGRPQLGATLFEPDNWRVTLADWDVF